MQRLGILGGTFDPIHIGHVLLAQAVREELALDQVLFVPAADPPHKEAEPPLAPAAQRWVMVELALESFTSFKGSRIELERPGKSYMYDTLQQLRALHPHTQLFLIIGADNIAPLSTWHKPQGILDQCTVVAGSRITAALDPDPVLAAQLLQVETPLIELSSTRIRQRLAAGCSIRYMVPEKVEAYIAEKGLYRSS